MKSLLLSIALAACLSASHASAAGSILSPGTYDSKELVTRLDHEVLSASSGWKIGDGEPPIGPGKAAELALAAQKKQFPELKDGAIKDVSLCASPNGCYYRVGIFQPIDMKAVAAAGGSMKPNQMNYYVLLNSSVIEPEIRD